MPEDGDMNDTTRTRKPAARLERSREDRIIAGVSGGLGTYMGANPWLFRLAFIILAFFGGLGVLLYIAAWLLVPDQGTRDPIISKWLGNLDMSDGGTIFGVVLVGAAVVIILAQVANVSSVLIVALVLFIVGLLLYRGDLTVKKPDDDPSEGGDMPEDNTSDSTVDNSLDASASIAVADPPMYEPPPPEPEVMWEPPPPKESSMLGRITVAFGLIVLASMALIDLAFETVSIEPVHYIATAVALLGLGLIVGGWVGRARWLIIIGVVLLPALWFTSFWPQDFSFSAGESRHEPTQVSDVQPKYELGFGQLVIDLSGLSAEELAQVGTVEASLGVGEMIVRLPNEVGAHIQALVGAGTVEGVPNEPSGVGINVTRIVPPEPPVVDLILEVGFGVVRIDGPAGVFDTRSEDTVVIIEGSSS